jgi:hypothetical protein
MIAGDYSTYVLRCLLLSKSLAKFVLGALIETCKIRKIRRKQVCMTSACGVLVLVVTFVLLHGLNIRNEYRVREFSHVPACAR